MTLKTSELAKKANWVRYKTVEICTNGRGGGHLASSLSCTDILVALYYGGILRFEPKNPRWEDRDRFFISKGHGGVSLYPILADLGFFPINELSLYCTCEGILGAHPDNHIPGFEAMAGSLGHGLGLGAGVALSAKMDGKEYETVVLLGDGECYEGAVWEAAMFAGHHRLDNLTAVIDRNGLCATDFTENCLRLNPLDEKFRDFGWEVRNVDGHSFRELLAALGDFRHRKSGRPLILVANTIKSKGISFMENNTMAHTFVPSGEQLERAKQELKWPPEEERA